MLGYGEISLVLGWPPERPALRLQAAAAVPLTRAGSTPTGARSTTTSRRSRAAGVRVVETELRGVERERRHASPATSCSRCCRPRRWRRRSCARATPAPGIRWSRRWSTRRPRRGQPAVGLDAQLANWTWDGGRAHLPRRLDAAALVGGRPLRGSTSTCSPHAYPGDRCAGRCGASSPRGSSTTYRDLRKVYLDLCGQPAQGAARRAGCRPSSSRSTARLDEPLSRGRGAPLLPLGRPALGRSAADPPARPRLAAAGPAAAVPVPAARPNRALRLDGGERQHPSTQRS